MAFSLFKWIISLFNNEDNPEKAKRRSLKRMAKILAANKYGKFYHLKTDEATADLAQFFFSIYKIISPAQAYLQNVPQSTQLKAMVVCSFLSKRQLDILEQFSPENIELRAQEMSSKDLTRQMQGEFETLAADFDTALISSINDCYNLILIIAKFVTYDFYFLLKKFDHLLIERSFSKKPQFHPVQGMAVSDEIKDFLELTSGLDPNRNWDTALRVLKEYKDADVVNPKLWNNLLLHIGDVKRSGILEMLIRFIEKDPNWGWEPHIPKEEITTAYLGAIRLETFEHLDRIAAAKQNARIMKYAKAVFGDTEVNRLKYYTERGSEIYRKKNFTGFNFARGLNYLIVFLTTEKEKLQYIYDLVLIRGQWISPTLSMPLSESIRLLMHFSERISLLDESLSDFGMYGNKLKSALARVEKEKNQVRLISTTLETLNNDAKQIINDAIFNLSVFDDSFQVILDDYRSNPSTIILNWEEMESFSETPLEDLFLGIHDKLDNMLQLLRLFVQDSDTAE